MGPWSNFASDDRGVQSDGGVIDPRTTDPALRAAIEETVGASIDADEDDDMDGNPDPLG